MCNGEQIFVPSLFGGNIVLHYYFIYVPTLKDLPWDIHGCRQGIKQEIGNIFHERYDDKSN